MKQYSIQQYKTVKHDIIPDIVIDEENETQEEVEREITFVQSSHDINNLVSLFVNDELKTLGEDYSIEDDRVIFTDVLNEDDKVRLNYIINSPLSLLSSSPKANSSVIPKYAIEDNKLYANNKYKININIDKEDYTWEFNTRMNPFLSSAKKIFEDIGEFIEGYTEEYINNVIYGNSLAVIDLIDQLKEEGVENVTCENEDGFIKAKHRAINNWVRYKTDIDLTLSRYFGISYRYGSELKEIGDIKIEKTTKLPYIDNLLDMLKRKFDEADELIRGGLNTVRTAVRAGTKYKYDDDWGRETKW